MFLKGINALSHQCMVGEMWYVTKICPLVWHRSLSMESDCDKLCLVKMENNLVCKVKIIYLSWISLFLGQRATLRGPAFSEQYFLICNILRKLSIEWLTLGGHHLVNGC